MIRILHVDDEPLEHELTRMNLQAISDDIDLRGLDSAEDALHLLGAEEFDCILSDYQMPGTDGLEFLVTLRESGFDTPFIFLTGQGNEKLAAEALRAGADDYYTKEEGIAHYDRLLNSIRRVIESRTTRVNLVTSRKALQKSESTYSLTFENAQVGIAHLDLRGSFIEANRRMREIIGYTEEEIRDLSFRDITHTDDLEESIRETGDLLEGRVDKFTMQKRYLRKDGSIIWANTSVVIVRDSEGNPLHFVAIVSDISEEIRYQQIQDTMHDILAATTSASSLADLVQGIHERVGTLIDAPNFYVALRDETTGAFSFPYHVDNKDRIENLTDQFLSRGLTSLVMREDRSMLLTHAQIGELAQKGEIDLIGTQAACWLGVPLQKNGEAFGVVAIQNYENEKAYSPKDLDLLTYISRNIAIAIERIQYLERIRKSEQKFRMLFSHMSEGVAVHDVIYDESGVAVDYLVTDANEQFERHTGLKRENIIGKRGSVAYGTDPAPYLEIYARVAVTGEAETLETYFPPIDKHFFISVSSPEKGSFVTVFFDITKQRTAEQALRESEERALKLAESINEVFWIGSPDWQIIHFISPAYEKVWGRSCQSLLDNPLSWQEAIVEEDREKVLQDILEKSAGKLETPDIPDYRIVRPDGSTRWIHARAFPIRNDDGVVTGIAGIAEDVTERRKVEEALRDAEAHQRALSDATFEAIFLSEKGICLSQNLTAQKMFGYTMEEAVGRPGTDWIIPQEREMVMNQMLNGFEKPYQTVALRKDGTTFPAEIQGRMLNFQDKQVRVTALRDITLRKRAEHRLQKSREQLIEANRELDAFSHTIAHDLKAPLRHLRGFVSILEKKFQSKLDTEGDDLLKSITDSAGQMEQLIDDILKFSKTARGEITSQRVNLSQIANIIAEELHRSAPGRNAVFEISPDVHADGDPVLLTVVLKNLLGNAWKYCAGADPSHIVFGTADVDGKTSYVVRDNGIGFDQSKMEKLFLPFQRLTTESEFEGTGIGLATVKKIIERHGGRIWAESRPGHGATFYFTIGE